MGNEDVTKRLNTGNELLLESFSSLNNSILEFQQKAQKEFLEINNLLQEFTHNTKSISNNLNQIASLLDHELNRELIDKFSHFTDTLIHITKQLCDEKIDSSNAYGQMSDELDQITSHVEFIKVELLNVQSLIDVTIENNDLTSNALKSKTTDNLLLAKLQHTVKGLNSIISTIIVNLQVKGENGTKLLAKFNELYLTLRIINNQVPQCHQRFSRLYEMMKHHSDGCFRLVDLVINKIQYQDIIHQKLNHILLQVDTLQSELKNSDQQLVKTSKFKYLIPELAKLNAWQLELSKHEYENSFNAIYNSINDILGCINANHCKEDSGYQELSEEINMLEDTFVQRCTEIEKIILTTPGNDVPQKNYWAELVNLLTKSKKLISILDVPSNKVVSDTNQATSDSKIEHLNQTINSQAPEHVKGINEFIVQSDHLKENFGKLIKNYNRIIRLLTTNIEYVNKISKDLSKCKESADGNMQLTNLIDDAISEFGTISEKNIHQSNHLTLSDKMSVLNEIRASYTMRSERENHDRLVAMLMNNEDVNIKRYITESYGEDEQEGALELF